MPDVKEVINGLEMSYKYSNVDENNTLVPQWIVLHALALLKAQEAEAVDVLKPDSDIGCWYDITHNYTLEQVVSALKAQEPVQPNGEQYQCNKCKFYQGVHNVMGHAPCSFWNIGGVLWNDYCSRFYDFR